MKRNKCYNKEKNVETKRKRGKKKQKKGKKYRILNIRNNVFCNRYVIFPFLMDAFYRIVSHFLPRFVFTLDYKYDNRGNY